MRHKIIDELIAEELKKTGGNVSKVARTLQLPYHVLIQRFGPTATNVLPLPAPRPADIKDLGKPGFRQHVIAIKRCGHDWPEEFAEVLADARRLFDAGTHEMFQTVNSGWVVQYLAQRRRPVPRRRFFEVLR